MTKKRSRVRRTNRRWSLTEDEMLMELCGIDERWAVIARQIGGRTAVACSARAAKLRRGGVEVRLLQRSPKRRIPWTRQLEAELVAMVTARVGWPEIARRLKRTENSVRGKWAKLRPFRLDRGHSAWSVDDVAFLLEQWASGASVRELAQLCKRSTSGIETKLSELRQAGKVGTRRRMWTKSEAAKAQALAADGMTAAEIGKLLGRSTGSIRHRVRAIRSGKRKEWTRSEIARARSMRASGVPINTVAVELGRTPSSVRSRINAASRAQSEASQ